MAKTDLTIDITGKLKKSYSVKGKTNIIIIGDFEDSIKSKVASGSTLTITLNDGRKFKLTNIADTHTININFDDNSMSLQNFYGVDYTKDWTPAKGTKVTGTVFDDYIDLSETTYAPTSKKAIKNNTGLTIKAGKGDDTVIGSRYNDTITGGLGINTVVYDTAEMEVFGNDTIKLTKGENLVIDLTSMNLDKEEFKGLLSHDRKNLFISLSDEEKVKLNSFYKSNGVGANGSVKVLLQEAQDETEEDLVVDLNEDLLLSFSSADAKKGVIKGSRLGDYITGGETIKTISAGAGNDYIESGAGNQKLSGGKGRDTFVFSADGDGVDTITDATRDDILQIDGVESIMDLQFKKSGKNLEIYYGKKAEQTDDNPLGLDDNNKIIIKNYFKTKEAKRIDTLMVGENQYSLSEDVAYIIQGSGKIKGTEKNDRILGSAKADTLYGYAGDDYLYGVGGNDKLIGGKGDDMLFGGTGKKTFAFASGDGDDFIFDAKKDDIIQLDSEVEYSFERSGDDLVLKYADDSVTISDYYTIAEDERIDTLKVKHGKKYDTVSIKEYLPVVPVDYKILEVNEGDNVVIPVDSEYNTLKFVSISDPQYVNCSRNVVGDTFGNDLIVECGTAKITLTDYMLGEHNIQFFQTGPYDTSYDIPYHIGTDGDDTFDAQIIQDYFFLKGGNDTVNFTGKNFTIMNELISEGTSENTLTLNFDNYSLEDGTLRFEAFINGGTGYNKLDIYASKEETNGTHAGGQASFDYYFSDNKPTIVINDSKGDSYTIDKVTSTYESLNWKSEEEKNKNHVAFIDTGENNKINITSNTETNVINVISGDLNYSYQGGHDSVKSQYRSNAEYYVGAFDGNTNLSITDNSGLDDYDALSLGNDTTNMRLIFNVDNNLNSVVWDDATLIYSGNFNQENVKGIITGTKEVNGIHFNVRQAEYDGDEITGYRCGIESFSTGDYLRGLDIDGWKDQIVKNVRTWLSNNPEYSSAKDAFNNCKDAAKLTALYNCYNVNYQDLTDVKTVYKEFTSTTGNDNYEFKLGNNKVTINNETIGQDTITSPATKYDFAYTDKLIFNNGMSFISDTLDVVADGDNIVIGKKGELDNNSVTYTDFLSNDANNDFSIINYDDGSQSEYHVRVEENRTIYMANDSFNDDNYSMYEKYIIFFKNNQAESNGVISNMQRNIFHTLGNEDFYYEGKCGTDKIYTHSTVSDDFYQVTLKRTDYDEPYYASLYINDNGGDNDVLHLMNVNGDDVRLVFDVDTDGVVNYDNYMIIHNDKFNNSTITSAVQNDLTEGVIKVEAKGTSSAFGIEKLSTSNNIPPMGPSGVFDTDAWVEAITSGVQGWLTAHNDFTSAYDAFENCKDADALADLVAAYNVDYTQLN